MEGHKWVPIEDLPENWQQMTSPELASLSPIWRDRREKLEDDSPDLVEFNARLQREWAIETGIIENLYTIDRGTTQLLIEKGLVASLVQHGGTDRPAEQVIRIIRDQEDALEGVFAFVKGGRDLTTSYVKELHAALTRHQPTKEVADEQGRRHDVPLLRGDWKKWANNPQRPDGLIHEYCPPVHVASEMDRLIMLHSNHISLGVQPEVEAAWLHHRFTQIHPFEDGNGRVARALASLIFLRAAWFPLVINRDMRTEYIEALEAADDGNLQPLVALFVRAQRDAFVKALSVSESVIRETQTLQDVISSAAERLRDRKEAKALERRRVFEFSTALEQMTRERFREAALNLDVELKMVDSHYFAYEDSSSDRPGTDHWYRSQIITVAKSLGGYYADMGTYRQWIRLRIREEKQSDIVVSFHALGVEFLGLMAATAFVEHRDRGEDDELSVEGPYTVCSEVFQFAYNEKLGLLRQRFGEWVNDALLNGLDQWRRDL